MMQPNKHLISTAACAVFFALAGCQGSPVLSTSFQLQQAEPNQNAKRFGVLARTDDTSCFGQPYAVFANNRTQEVQISGSTNKIQGDLHTNASLKETGNQNQITGIAEATSFDVKGNKNTIGTQRSTVQEGFPCSYEASAFLPTFNFPGDVDLKSVPDVWARPGVLKPGVYKSPGKISLSGNGAQGQVTFVAASVQISGTNNSLLPFENGLLFLATGTGNNTVHISGNGNSLGGMINSPNGEFQLTGSENAIQGMVMTDVAKVAGSRNSIVFEDFGFCKPAPAPSPAPSADASASTDPGPGTNPGGGGVPVDPSPTPTTVTATPTPPPASGSTWSFSKYGTPFAVAVDAANDIWTTNDGSTLSVSKSGNDGAPLGSRLVGTNAHDLAIEPNASQHVWVTVFDDNLVYAFNPDLTPVWGNLPNTNTPVRWALPGHLEGIAFNSAQKPWVCAWGEGLIYELDPVAGPNGANGGKRIVHNFGSATANPRGIVFDGSGNAWVALNGANMVVKLGPDGKELGHIATDAHPSRLAIDHAGNVWVTCTGTDVDFLTQGEVPGNTVMKINAACTLAQRFQVGNSPYGITVTPAGDILVVNGGSFNTMRLDAATGALRQTYVTGSSAGSHPTCVAMDHTGFAWVTVFTDNLLLKIWP